MEIDRVVEHPKNLDRMEQRGALVWPYKVRLPDMVR